MALAHDRCICLRKTEYSETSQILVLFGREHGVLRVIAKGAHRRTKAGAGKFDGGIDLLDLGHAVFSASTERDLGTLTEWSLEEGNLAIRKNLRAMYLGLYAVELVGSLIEEHDPHPELFDRLASLLAGLTTPKVEEVFLAFQLDLLQEAGYLPELNACVECGNAAVDRAYFSPARGGILCRNCESSARDRNELDVRFLRIIRNLIALQQSSVSDRRLPQLTRHQADPINKLLWQHIVHTLSRRLRMAEYVL